MRIAKASLLSAAPYSQSAPHNTPKLPKENSGDWEARTWANRVHHSGGQVFIPAMALQNCISEAAKFLSIQIPGKGKSTYTKHFEAGVIVPNSIALETHKGEPVVPPSEENILSQRKRHSPDSISKGEAKVLKEWERPANEVWGDWVFVPSDGVAGSGKRVWKCYPMVSEWKGTVDIYIGDDTITNEVFSKVLTQAGQLIGLGRFRMRNRGNYGAFKVADLKFVDF